MLPTLILSSDSHVFEPPDLWTTRIDRAFRHRAPRMERIGGADQLVVEERQVLSGIGLISNAGARFEAPETISGQGRFEDVHRGGYDPDQHLRDMALDGVAGEVLYPSQGLFYFRVADSALMSAIFRAYNDWLAEFCRTDPARLKGIAMINLDDVPDGIRELERAAGLGPTTCRCTSRSGRPPSRSACRSASTPPPGARVGSAGPARRPCATRRAARPRRSPPPPRCAT
jgi:hypothetical protein